MTQRVRAAFPPADIVPRCSRASDRSGSSRHRHARREYDRALRCEEDRRWRMTVKMTPSASRYLLEIRRRREKVGDTKEKKPAIKQAFSFPDDLQTF
ncbi:hypothetical protein [Paraburkholderia bannensis]|uniref:hypothetical protein n=1 Tax=Paraburkholderia bannensis TaxID=765414 RepID=UPI002AB7ACC2|nr:hypothetical protein [Paraburkholderia bannensis]